MSKVGRKAARATPYFPPSTSPVSTEPRVLAALPTHTASSSVSAVQRRLLHVMVTWCTGSPTAALPARLTPSPATGHCAIFGLSCAASTTTGYGDVVNGLVNSSSPDKGVTFTLKLPLRNRTAQADQARSLIEYRQAEMHLEQLYTQIHMQVVNKLYALTNDRAQAMAAQAAAVYTPQTLEARQKTLLLGATTTTTLLPTHR